MPRPTLSKEKAKERYEFLQVMDGHVIAVENSIEVTVSKNALYWEEIRDFNSAIKRLKEIISRIR